MTTNDKLMAELAKYINEQHNFEVKGIKIACTRARHALSKLAQLAKARRVEMLFDKKAMGTKVRI